MHYGLQVLSYMASWHIVRWRAIHAWPYRPGGSIASLSSATLITTVSLTAGSELNAKLQGRDMYSNKASYDDFYPSDDWSLTATLDSGDVGVDADLVIINAGGAKAEGRAFHSSTSQLNLSRFSPLNLPTHPTYPTKIAQVKPQNGRL